MTAKDIHAEYPEKRASLDVLESQIRKAMEMAPSGWDVVLEMGREYIRMGAQQKVLNGYPDSALARAIRELQATGFDPDTE